MKRHLLTLFLTFYALFQLKAAEITIEGVFNGENIYIMNPFAATGVGFCIYEVTVNGQTVTDEINSSAFEVDLSVFQFKTGDELVVVIKHKPGCTPKVINPEVLKPRSTFTVTNITVDKTGVLKWTTIEENGSLPFTVEQFKWNKWVKVDVVQGKGKPSKQDYQCAVVLHSGENRFRVKQIDYSKRPRYSLEATFNNRMMAKVTFSPSRPKNEILFSAETQYEIYDFYGKLRKKGNGNKVDITDLENGDYFMNFDNETAKFSKK